MKQYQDALKQIQAEGISHDDRTKVGTTSLFGEVQMTFDISEKFPILTTKKVPLRWIFEELMWFLRGDTDNQSLEATGVTIWKEWATEEQTARFGRSKGDLGPIYGYTWRNFGGKYPEKNGFDQIARLMKDLKENPNSRRHIVSGKQIMSHYHHVILCFNSKLMQSVENNTYLVNSTSVVPTFSSAFLLTFLHIRY